MKNKVVVGLSGGVDSSVAAWVLKKEGFDVAALFMRNWNDTTGLLISDCHWEDDFMFAEMVAKKLEIPFHFVDLSESYSKRVVDYMFKEYKNGRTPNPDVLCNREIKFDSFAKEARKLGADYIATGHYCRKEVINRGEKKIYRLLSGKDLNKDQSYFLCQIGQEQLATALFPIGHMSKPQVRKIAADLGLPTATRKDSQGICFIGKVHLPTFLKQKLEPINGSIISIPSEKCNKKWLQGIPGPGLTFDDLVVNSKSPVYTREMGTEVGIHEGAHFFTIGQRKGLNVGGLKEPLFVIGTDTHDNIVYVGEGATHPGLYRKGLKIRKDEIHWIRDDLELRDNESRVYEVRIRYRQPLQKARLFKKYGEIYILFDKLQRGITAGQFAAWYDGDELLGSGVIDM